VYVLESVRGQPLPAVQFLSPRDRRFEVHAESLWFRRDGSFIARGAYRQVEDGRDSRWNASDSGRYVLQGSILSEDGQLASGDVILMGGPGLSSRFWAKSGGLFLEGSGLPQPTVGTAGLIPRTYRRVSQPGG
jgi:hypothetical protein